MTSLTVPPPGPINDDDASFSRRSESLRERTKRLAERARMHDALSRTELDELVAELAVALHETTAALLDELCRRHLPR